MNLLELKQIVDAAIEQGKGEYQVHFAYDYGDHWHTTIAPEVSNMEEQFVADSDYHNKPAVIDEDKIERVIQDHKADDICTDVNPDGSTEMSFNNKEVRQVFVLSAW